MRKTTEEKIEALNAKFNARQEKLELLREQFAETIKRQDIERETLRKQLRTEREQKNKQQQLIKVFEKPYMVNFKNELLSVIDEPDKIRELFNFG